MSSGTLTRPPGSVATPRRTAAPDPVARSRFRADIEGLRAVAVLLVVLYHAGVPFLGGGYVGVDVFFVISGFLITSHLVTQVERDGRVHLGDFYARRIRRLLPASLTVVAATTVAAYVLLNPLAASSARRDAVWSALFGMNIHLADEGVSYFGVHTLSPLQHYWSLAVEEQFYLVWPVAIGVLYLLTRTLSRIVRRRTVLVVALAVSVASFAWSVHETTAAPSYAYFLAPSRAWELGVGAVVALGIGGITRLPRAVRYVLGPLGLVAVVASAVVYSDQTAFPGTAALAPVLGAALVIISGTGSLGPAQTWLSVPPLVGVGRVSYGWYLWHWPVLVLAPAVVGHPLGLLGSCVSVVIGLWLAVITYVALENPVRSLPALARPIRSAALGVGVGVLTAVGILVAPLFAPSVAHPGPPEAAPQFTDQAQLSQVLREALRVPAVPTNLTPNAAALEQDRPAVTWAGGRSCMLSLQAVSIAGSCKSADTSGPTRVVLVGDSHVYQWYPAMLQIARQRDWTLYVVAKSGCPIYDTTIYSTEFKRDYTECNAWRANAFAKVQQIDPDLVVVSGFVASDRGAAYANDWLDGVTSSIDRLRASGTPVAAVMDTPWPRHDVPTCLAENVGDARACAVPAVQSWRDATRESGTPGAAAAAGATVIDPTPWLCVDGSCPAIVGNVPVYNDDTHMSATWSALLAPVLARALPLPRAR